MPKQFVFKVDDDITFECILNATQCTGHAKSGSRCKRKCITGFEFCHTHMKSNLRICIKPSNIEGGGQGIFAFGSPNTIVFRSGDTITEYNGQVLEMETIAQRYGKHTAPYTVQMNKQYAVDCACKRGVGGMTNTLPNHNNSTFSIDNKNRKVKIKATKNIHGGEEIYVSYGRSYHVDEDGVEHFTKYVRKK